MTALLINDDQANSLLDLINDQIRSQRRNLRHDSLNRTHLSALTHFRNLKRLILAKEKEDRKQITNDLDELENQERAL